MSSANRRRGFSLLELMLVLVIISILGTVAALNLTSSARKARLTATRDTIRTVVNALDQYQFENGEYPSKSEWDAGVLWSGADAMLKDKPVDAWKNELLYFYPTNNTEKPFEVFSMGPDQEAGTQDDISSWQLDEEA